MIICFIKNNIVHGNIKNVPQKMLNCNIGRKKLKLKKNTHLFKGTLNQITRFIFNTLILKCVRARSVSVAC